VAVPPAKAPEPKRKWSQKQVMQRELLTKMMKQYEQDRDACR
jgi:hypothetical protein